MTLTDADLHDRKAEFLRDNAPDAIFACQWCDEQIDPIDLDDDTCNEFGGTICEALRQQRSGLGVDLPGFRWMSGADVIAEAIRREASRQHPDAVLRRALMSAFNAAVEAGEMDRAEIYDRAYSASCRGSEGWQLTARGLVGLGQARAAA